MFCYDKDVTNRTLGEILDLSPGGLFEPGEGYPPTLIDNILIIIITWSPLTCFEVYFFARTLWRAVDFGARVVDAVRAFYSVASAMREPDVSPLVWAAAA